jgi:glycosyltransferase involved in cell wall biosynthesis
MTHPTVSVIMPVYNGADYLREALDSIFAQTFEQFELIVIDDGSTDSSEEILKQYSDSRLRLFFQPNSGLAATLNRGIELAQGQYIARMDQDDISRPERFAKQVAFLEKNPRCALLGTWAEIWEVRVKTERIHAHPTDNATLRFELLFNNPFAHSSVMLRREAVMQVGGYSTDPSRQPPEDYELWSRLARHYELANLPEVLHIYREIPRSMSRAGVSPFLLKLLVICAENIAWASNDSPDNPDVRNIPALFHSAWERVEGRPDIFAMRRILKRANPEQHSRFFKIAQARLLSSVARYWEVQPDDVWQKKLITLARRGYQHIKRTQNFEEAKQ